jgi:hypothetical protein
VSNECSSLGESNPYTHRSIPYRLKKKGHPTASCGAAVGRRFHGKGAQRWASWANATFHSIARQSYVYPMLSFLNSQNYGTRLYKLFTPRRGCNIERIAFLNCTFGCGALGPGISGTKRARDLCRLIMTLFSYCNLSLCIQLQI